MRLILDLANTQYLGKGIGMLDEDFFGVLESLIDSSLDDKRADRGLFLFNDNGLQSIESSGVEDVPGFYMFSYIHFLRELLECRCIEAIDLTLKQRSRLSKRHRLMQQKREHRRESRRAWLQ